MRAAEQAAQQCDVMLIIGSSLEVAPINDLPRVAQSRGAKIILVNLGPTYMDRSADVLIRADVAEALPAIVSAIREN